MKQGKERETETLHPLVYSPNGGNDQGQAEVRSLERHQVSHSGASAQARGSSSAAFSGALVGSLIRSGAARTGTGTHMGCLTGCVTTLAPKPEAFLK